VRKLIAAASAALLLATGTARDAVAWTDAGHRIVAEIATGHLTAKARRQVALLLDAQKAASLADISMWADIAKAVPMLGQPSHVVHMPLDGRAYDPARDCRKGRCALAAMAEHLAILGDPDADVAVRVVALNMVVHLVADLHQPLHTSADTGQRRVAWRGTSMTLHRFWDEEIVAARGADWRALAVEVGGGGCADVADTEALAWALEGRDIARDTILSDPRIASGGVAVLPASYPADAWPLVRERLRLAGCRLGMQLNRSLAGGPG
jgi:hypothetical protein